MSGITKTSIDKKFVNKIFIIIMQLRNLQKLCTTKNCSYTVCDWISQNLTRTEMKATL